MPTSECACGQKPRLHAHLDAIRHACHHCKYSGHSDQPMPLTEHVCGQVPSPPACLCRCGRTCTPASRWRRRALYRRHRLRSRVARCRARLRAHVSVIRHARWHHGYKQCRRRRRARREQPACGRRHRHGCGHGRGQLLSRLLCERCPALPLHPRVQHGAHPVVAAAAAGLQGGKPRTRALMALWPHLQSGVEGSLADGGGGVQTTRACADSDHT